ncbi:MAG: RdgB/HAM1 family non-canonical purine NTP pyrophosphatase [Legionella sp.]|nr:RdgB/HAM1 family non-canonical purine NTP pyrophosphatase [Legionella sp.]
MKNRIVLATGNSGKINEFKALLQSKHCIPQRDLGIDDADETGLTFLENALIKARHASRISNIPAIADDSGLVVPALQGKPGIYSSRFAGEQATDQDNIKYLLKLLKNQTNSTEVDAYFYCVIVYMQHADDPTPLFGTGRLDGQIVFNSEGTYGFGYDPVFYLKEYGCTLAELPATTKNTLSHRARALKTLGI